MDRMVNDDKAEKRKLSTAMRLLLKLYDDATAATKVADDDAAAAETPTMTRKRL